jgi:hypothetical protein
LLRKEKTQSSQVGDGAFGRQAFGRADGFEPMAFTNVLAFTAVLSGFTVAIAFAVVNVVAVHGVVGGDGFACGAFRGVSSKSAGRQGQNSCGHGERGGGSGFHEDLLDGMVDGRNNVGVVRFVVAVMDAIRRIDPKSYLYFCLQKATLLGVNNVL